jgi:calcineurin-like phosphoesterase family protein
MTNKGTVSEIQAHIDWLDSLPHAHKFVIAGNHDTYLDPKSRMTLSKTDQYPELDWREVLYMQHNTIKVTFPATSDLRSRIITIYGAPHIPQCGGPDFAFQYARGMDAWSETVPKNIDILITHTPPKYHLDLFSPWLGCEYLLREVWRTKPRLHVFGHVHAGAGRQTVWWNEGQAMYERAMARMGRVGLVRQVVSVRLWWDLVCVTAWGVIGAIWDWGWGGEKRATMFVNAALMYNNTGKLGNKVQVVDI